MKPLQVGCFALMSVALGTCAEADPVHFGPSSGGGASQPGSGGSVTHSSGGGRAVGGTSSADGGAPASGGTTSGGASSGGAGNGGTPAVGGSGPHESVWSPPGHVPLELARLSDALFAYVPNRGGAFALRGSGHTHCAPDHSGIAPETQERRLRDLPGNHEHDFVWMTAHGFVAPSPQVPGIIHMFGVEVYTATLPSSGVAPHMLAYLPNGSLANATQFPFGAFDLDLGAAASAIRDHGGLPALAHPARLPPTQAEMDAVGEQLWGMEVTSGSSDADDNLVMVDHRLTTGRYVCLTAGGDIHDENDRMTRGYQVVSVDTRSPDAIFAAVSACNLFACGTQTIASEPLEPPQLRVIADAIELSLPRTADTIRFIGRGGAVLAEYSGVASARYAPKLGDLYVRVEAVDDGGAARCYSQPIWLVDGTTLSSAP